MKKLILLGAAAMMAFGASAQMSLVKDLSKKASSGNPQELMEVLQNIVPALTNPESANDVLTWYTAGKAAFGLYDKMYEAKLMKQPVDDKDMANALTTAYAYYPKLNKDGSKKVKTKYSKEIIGSLTTHLNDIANVGNIFLQANDWANAAAAFGNYADLSSSPFAIEQGVAPANDILAEVRFYQGYSQYQIQDFENAYHSLEKARKLGYTDNNIVDFQTSALANMIQGMLDKSEYEKANSFIDNALKDDPMNGT